MKKFFCWIGILATSLIFLSACTSANSNNEKSSSSSEPNEVASANTPIAEATEHFEDAAHKYWVATGLACAKETTKFILEEAESGGYIGFIEDEGQLQLILQAFQQGTCSAIWIPFHREDIGTKLQFDPMGAYEYLPELLQASTLYNMFYRRSPSMSTNEGWESLGRFEGVFSTLPDTDFKSATMLIFYGDPLDPDAGIMVSFDSKGNNLVWTVARCFGKELGDYFMNSCQDWLDEGTEYTKQEIEEIEKEYDVATLAAPNSDVEDINKFLTETAIDINHLFCQNLAKDGVEQCINELGYLENVQYTDIREWVQTANQFDIGIILPHDYYYSGNLSLSQSSLRFLTNTSQVYQLPQDWTEDTCIILGSQDAECFAMILFEACKNPGVGGLGGNYLRALYFFEPFNENDRFMKVFSEDNISHDSPYGDWTEYAGIQNIKYVEPEIDPDDYYDYLLCSGGGYSIVAKQVESVTNVTEYIGVINDNYEWVVPLSIDTPFNPNGKIIRISYDSYEDRCEQLAGHIRYMGNGVFAYIGETNAGNYRGDMLNVENGTWFNPGTYDSTSLSFHNGYFITATGFPGQNIVKIIAATGDIRETEIYCYSASFIGQYSEDLFFAYDGFYDLNCNKIIDLSEYEGLIINHPYFENGQCTLIAENSNGTQYTGIIDSSGNFISEFTKNNE